MNLLELEDGGTFDEDSVPDWMRPLRELGQQSIQPHMPQQSQLQTFTENPQLSGFVRLPEGMSPVIGAHNDGLTLPVPGAPPPGYS